MKTIEKQNINVTAKKTLKKKKIKKINMNSKKKSATKKNVKKVNLKKENIEKVEEPKINVSVVSNKTISKKKKRKYSINFYRFVISTSILISILLGFFMHYMISNISITKNTNISAIDAKKNSKKILELYNAEGVKENFLASYKQIQESLNTYVFDNDIDETELDSIIIGINKELENRVWSTLNLKKPTFFNGTWFVENDKKLKFKFTTRKIEPNWILDEAVADKIVLN